MLWQQFLAECKIADSHQERQNYTMRKLILKFSETISIIADYCFVTIEGQAFNKFIIDFFTAVDDFNQILTKVTQRVKVLPDMRSTLLHLIRRLKMLKRFLIQGLRKAISRHSTPEGQRLGGLLLRLDYNGFYSQVSSP